MVHRFLPFFTVIALALTLPVNTVVHAQTPITPVTRKAILPFDELKRMVDKQVGGRMIGSEFDKASYTYQFRYMRGTELVDVIVDARSGKILGRRESM